MPHLLQPHPASPAPGPFRIEADAYRSGEGALRLRYRLSGEIGRLRLPPPAEPLRADGLWRSTCFEAFVRPAPGPGYAEFNFAPSTRWAAYRFAAYREGMTPLELPAPLIVASGGEAWFGLEASLDPGLADADWDLGLAAVVEDVWGGLSYWALAHPPGRPDFHHRDCFAARLPAPQRS